MFIRDLVEVKPILQSWLLSVHVTSALIGYSAIAISAVYGFLYLMLYHDIKASRFGVIYKRLPSLAILEEMNTKATILALVFLGIAILMGFVWLPRAFEEFSYTDPKLVDTVIIWLLYAGSLVAKRIGAWQGRRIMVLSLFGFAITFFSLTIVNIFFSAFHKFY
jgi:ABC-type transport system involved in cytochrome c biogenesis permease subunit